MVGEILRKLVLSRAASFHLDVVRGRLDRPAETQVQQVGAVVAGGHHGDGYAHPGLAGFVAWNCWICPIQAIRVGEGSTHFGGAVHVMGDLYGEIGAVFPRPPRVSDIVEFVGELRRLRSTHAVNDAFADDVCFRLAQRVRDVTLREFPIGVRGQERAAVVFLVKRQVDVFAGFVVLEGYLEAFVGHQLGGYVGSHVQRVGQNQVSVVGGLRHRVLKGRLARRQAKSVVGITQGSRFPAGCGGSVVRVAGSQILPGRCRQPHFVAVKGVEHVPMSGPADAAVGFVRDNQLEPLRRDGLAMPGGGVDCLNGGDGDWR